MAFLVKEEILRNVIRTHEVVLVAGWAGTGKTSTALRAAKDLGDVFYFNEAAPDARALVARHNEKAVVLHDVREFGAVKSGQPLLIADELNKAGAETLKTLDGIVSGNTDGNPPGKPGNAKVILITRLLMEARDFLPKVNVVIRFKHDIAEVLLTSLADIDKI